MLGLNLFLGPFLSDLIEPLALSFHLLHVVHTWFTGAVQLVLSVCSGPFCSHQIYCRGNPASTLHFTFRPVLQTIKYTLIPL